MKRENNAILMMSSPSYPTSLILEGPLFSDEIRNNPQHYRKEHDIESLRLVPSKSAASGVHTIYFRPEHRQWALVRLATRYRGLFEIQLQRGMSGEHQLLRQGFSSQDLDFLFDIIPQPPEEYSPIVYDMLWLVATYEKYLTVAEAVVRKEVFVPQQLLESTSGVNTDDSGFFTRFLRHHLIEPVSGGAEAENTQSRSGSKRVTIELEKQYKMTPEGKDALAGIIQEHERIFDKQEFEPLLINPELDPLEHIRTHYEKSEDEPMDVSVDSMADQEGILGDIAESFAPLDDEFEPGGKSDAGTVKTGAEAENESTGQVPRGTHEVSGPIPSQEKTRQPTKEKVADEEGQEQVTHKGAQGRNNKDSPQSSANQYADAEIRQAAIAAGKEIKRKEVAHTSHLKQIIWEEVEVSSHSRGQLWNHVQTVLLEMESISGRPSGRVWTYIPH